MSHDNVRSGYILHSCVLFCQVIVSLQAKESSNEPLSIPNSGGRNKGVKR